MSNVSMRKNFSEYSVYIFDLDGTLYFQKKLRFIMATRLASYYLLHFWSLKDLFVLKKFREVREDWDSICEDNHLSTENSDVDTCQYEYVAEKMNVPVQKVKDIVAKWIYDNPLDAVARSKDAKLLNIISGLRKKGRRVIVFSDYPTEDKLKVLRIEIDGSYCSTDSNIGEMKPSPKGLTVILEDLGILSEDAIMIGDRMEKDGKCAALAGVDYYIIPRSGAKRNYRIFE